MRGEELGSEHAGWGADASVIAGQGGHGAAAGALASEGWEAEGAHCCPLPSLQDTFEMRMSGDEEEKVRRSWDVGSLWRACLSFEITSRENVVSLAV